jgi:uncharacterized protein YjiS (DUF1127 family)
MKTKALWQAVARAAASLRLFLRSPRRDRGAEELAAMEERELSDLGIGRGEIPYLAGKPAESRGRPDWQAAGAR